MDCWALKSWAETERETGSGMCWHCHCHLRRLHSARSRSLGTRPARPGPTPALMVSMVGSGSSLGHSLSEQVQQWRVHICITTARVLQIISLPFCTHWSSLGNTNPLLLFEEPDKQIEDKITSTNCKKEILRRYLQDSKMHQWAGNLKYESTPAPQGTSFGRTYLKFKYLTQCTTSSHSHWT